MCYHLLSRAAARVIQRSRDAKPLSGSGHHWVELPASHFPMRAIAVVGKIIIAIARLCHCRRLLEQSVPPPHSPTFLRTNRPSVPPPAPPASGSPLSPIPSVPE